MKRGKKSKLTLGVILMLAVMFVGTTVVAAADGAPAFTWDPDTILAGDRDAIIGNDKDARTVIFARPDTMVFEAKYDVAVTNEQGEVVEWQPDATSTLFTMSPDDISQLPPAAEPSYIWHYYPVASPSPEMTVGQYGTDGKAWHAFSMPGKYHVWMDVQYKWSAMPTNAPTSDPFRWATYHTEGDITVANGQPVLSDHLHQEVNSDTNDIYNMNHLTIQAGAKQIDAPDSYEKFYTTWHRDPHGLYVTANRTAAGHGADNYTGDGPPLVVTVYVEDGDKGRVELGTKSFAIDVINGYDGEKIAYNEFKLPTVDVDATGSDGQLNLSKLKPGVYVLKADAAANDVNDATTSDIGELTVVGVSKVTVDPASLSVENGETQQQKFTANVDVVETDQYKVSDKTVTWSISGQQSKDTKIDPKMGMLTIGADEPAGTITVTAESVFDNNGQGKARGEAKVTVTKPDHSVIGGPTEIKEGQDGNWSFKGKFANLSRLSLNGVDFTIVPESAAKAQLKYPGYNGVAGIAVEGSVDVTLYKEFLATLPAGTYKLEATFNDGGVQNIGSTQFAVIREEAQPTATAAPTATATAPPEKKAPKTGDETDVWLWVVLAAAGACILGAAAGAPILRRKKQP